MAGGWLFQTIVIIIVLLILLPEVTRLLLQSKLPERIKQWLYYGAYGVLVVRPMANVTVPRYRLTVQGGGSLARCLYLADDYEPTIVKLLMANLRSGDVFVDIGANEGWLTMTAALTGAQVLAFEPSPSNLRLLYGNIEANNLTDQVVVYPVALGAQNGTTTFHESVLNGMWSSIGQGKTNVLSKAITVPLRRLDTIISSAVWHRVRMVKIDVEGFEWQVIEGASRHALDRIPIYIIETDSTTEEGDQVLSCFERLGYDIYELKVDSIHLPGYEPKLRRITYHHNLGFRNYIFARPSELIIPY